MRRFIFAVVLLAGGLFVILRLAEVQQVAETLRQGDWRYIGISFFFLGIWQLDIAASYKVIYHALGLDEKYERLILISSASNFVNVIAPSIGMGGMAVLISEARRRGYSTGRVTAAGVLVVLFDYLGFLCVLTLGLLVLFRRNNLSSVEVGASFVLFVTALILASLIFVGMRSAQALGDLLARIANRINHLVGFFTSRYQLSEHRAHQFAKEASTSLNELRNKPLHLSLAIGFGLGSKLLLIVILLLVFLSFGVPYSIGTIIAGFSIGYLFFIVSPTPAGIGFVEGGLTLALTTLNVPLGAAAVITLAYRGITFWLPLFFGMLAFRLLSHSGEVERSL